MTSPSYERRRIDASVAGYLIEIDVKKHRPENTASIVNLELIIEDSDDENILTVMKFANVVNLNISNLDGSGLSDINVVDITEDGLENIRFSVRDNEITGISFYCGQYSIEVVQRTKR